MNLCSLCSYKTLVYVASYWVENVSDIIQLFNFQVWCNIDVIFLYLFLLCLTENELATPPLDGIILPGVTRQSILDLARNWVSVSTLAVMISAVMLQHG